MTNFPSRLHTSLLVVLKKSLVVLAAAIVMSVLGSLFTSVEAQQPDDASLERGNLVQIWVRKLDSGNLEFGLRDGEEYKISQNRFLFYENAVVGTWYYSDEILVGPEGDQALVRIQARKLQSGNVEFGLQVLRSLTWLPRARFFMYNRSSADDPLRFSSNFYTADHSSICLGTAVSTTLANERLLADCEALLEAKDELAGQQGRHLNWATARDIETWDGVTLSNSRVTALDLDSYGLGGVISPSLGYLTALERLDLSSNRITGTIPASLGRLLALRELLLDENPSLDGCIPAGLRRSSANEGINTRVTASEGALFCHDAIPVSISDTAIGGAPPAAVRELPDPKPLMSENEARSICTNGRVIPNHAQSLYANIVSDCITLLRAKERIEGNGENLNWSADRSLTQWEGVTVTTRRFTLKTVEGTPLRETEDIYRVTSLDLSGKGLRGYLPKIFRDLTGLESFIDRRILSRDNNRYYVGIPAEWGNMGKLKRLELSAKGMSGTIPTSFSNLTNVEEIILSQNHLRGSIPSFLGSLTTLKVLNLSGNEFTGSVPPSLGDLLNLELLRLQDNRLSSPLSPRLADLSKLLELDLSNNDLTGTLPTWFSQDSSLDSLEKLYLNFNRLGGTLTMHAKALPVLDSLKLGNNQFTNISSAFCTLEVRKLDITNNNFETGLPKCLPQMTRLETLKASNAGLTGSIPNNWPNSSKLNVLDLSHNRLQGGLPVSLGNTGPVVPCTQSNAGAAYFDSDPAGACGIYSINLSHNQLEGRVPPEWGKLGALGELYLNNNQLSGRLPSELGRMWYLQTLDLRGNSTLTGCVPGGLKTRTVGSPHVYSSSSTREVKANILVDLVFLNSDGSVRFCGG